MITNHKNVEAATSCVRCGTCLVTGDQINDLTLHHDIGVLCIDCYEKVICSCCGEPLTEDELGDPYDGFRHGGVVCDICYFDEYCFICDNCEEHVPRTQGVAVDDLFAIVGDSDKSKPVGLYVILEHPFYTSNLLSAWFNSGSIVRVADIPASLECIRHRKVALRFCDDCQLGFVEEMIILGEELK